MGLLYDTFNTLEDLFVHELEDIYDAEQRIHKALPKMEGAATHDDLKAAFRQHTIQTEMQVRRLEQVFEMLGKKPRRTKCYATEGLIEEGSHVISAGGDDDVRDAGLIAAAQKVEHYEIATYGTLRNLARRLGRHDAAALLQQTLDEEGQTDEKLTQLAESHINAEAAAAK